MEESTADIQQHVSEFTERLQSRASWLKFIHDLAKPFEKLARIGDSASQARDAACGAAIINGTDDAKPDSGDTNAGSNSRLYEQDSSCQAQSGQPGEGTSQQPLPSCRGSPEQPLFSGWASLQQPLTPGEGNSQQPFTFCRGACQQPTSSAEGRSQQPFVTSRGSSQQPCVISNSTAQEPGLSLVNTEKICCTGATYDGQITSGIGAACCEQSLITLAASDTSDEAGSQCSDASSGNRLDYDEMTMSAARVGFVKVGCLLAAL